MDNLAQIKFSDNNFVSARDIHEFLEIKTSYTRWFERQVATYGFRLVEDFMPKMAKTSVNGRPQEDHFVNLDMAKELCMTSKGDKAKQARLYFIECEKKLKTQEIQNSGLSFAEVTLRAAQQLVEHEKRLIAVEQKIDNIEAQQLQAQQSLLALPEPQVTARKMTDRALVRQVVNTYAIAKKLDHRDVWNKLYTACYYRLQINAQLQAKNQNLKPLDILEKEGVMTEVYAIACELLK